MKPTGYESLYVDAEIDHLKAEVTRLRAALEAVEWVETEYDGTTYEICPWCHAQLGRPDEDHNKSCLRAKALKSCPVASAEKGGKP